MISKINKNCERKKRHRRIRKKVAGSSTKPRLCVFRSLKNIYVQAIDDVNGVTVASASTKEKGLALPDGADGGNVAGAKAIGEIIGKRLKEKSIDTIVFDRSGYLYHGRIAALAEGARSTGLVF